MGTNGLFFKKNEDQSIEAFTNVYLLKKSENNEDQRIDAFTIVKI